MSIIHPEQPLHEVVLDVAVADKNNNNLYNHYIIHYIIMSIYHPVQQLHKVALDFAVAV